MPAALLDAHLAGGRGRVRRGTRSRPRARACRSASASPTDWPERFMKVSGLSSRTFSLPNFFLRSRRLEALPGTGRTHAPRRCVRPPSSRYCGGCRHIWPPGFPSPTQSFIAHPPLAHVMPARAGFAKARLPVSGWARRPNEERFDDRPARHHAHRGDRRTRGGASDRGKTAAAPGAGGGAGADRGLAHQPLRPHGPAGALRHQLGVSR